MQHPPPNLIVSTALRKIVVYMITDGLTLVRGMARAALERQARPT